DPDFAPEPVSTADAHAWRDTLLAEIDETRELLGRPPAGLPPSAREAIERLLAAGERLRDTAAGIAELAGSGAVKIRQHGDYHLGQLLVSEDGFIILDFEGEPSRSLAERRAKHTPLKDVAGMLRSLSYAAAAGLFAAAGGSHQLEARLEPWADLWLDLARERFLGAYASELARAPRGLLPTSRDATERALAALELEKALYELRYELNNRPDWLRVPLRGIERTLVGL
ncbi:MAG TPA: hypothetical protein VNT60_03615, partial [Deinococcales bacterium]|nr:hypothetical protein [Deinococcales bacterium]